MRINYKGGAVQNAGRPGTADSTGRAAGEGAGGTKAGVREALLEGGGDDYGQDIYNHSKDKGRQVSYWAQLIRYIKDRKETASAGQENNPTEGELNPEAPVKPTPRISILNEEGLPS